MGLAGRWRIVAMEEWDREALDLVSPAFIEFTDDDTGRFGFVAVRGWMDCRPTTTRDGRAAVEFSWAGDDDGDPVSGRGWARLDDDGASLVGHVFIHLGDESAFRAEPFT